MRGFATGKALPYQLSMRFEYKLADGTSHKQHFCGATLIKSKYAISALHCFMHLDRIIYEVDLYSLFTFLIQLNFCSCKNC